MVVMFACCARVFGETPMVRVNRLHGTWLVEPLRVWVAIATRWTSP